MARHTDGNDDHEGRSLSLETGVTAGHTGPRGEAPGSVGRQGEHGEGMGASLYCDLWEGTGEAG